MTAQKKPQQDQYSNQSSHGKTSPSNTNPSKQNLNQQRENQSQTQKSGGMQDELRSNNDQDPRRGQDIPRAKQQ